VAGTFNISIMRRPLDTARRTPASSFNAACPDMRGSPAVAMDMPKSPIGMYINLNA
jgi:hypothetical protein